MPTIKNENGVYTLRNTKGNELKVSELGAKVISLRFRNKKFENKFIIQESINDGDKWQAEQFIEGVKFTNADKAYIYSISNDNEISIKTENTAAEFTFNAEVFPAPEIKVYSEEFKGDGIGSFKVIDKPAQVEMELGMFGFDIGCPIDWLNAGLKNAAELMSADAGIQIKIYTSAENINLENSASGLKVKTFGGVVNAQTVFVLKNI